MKAPISSIAFAAATSFALVSQAAVTPTDGFSVNNWQGTPTYKNYNTTPLNSGTGGAFVNETSWGTGLSLMNTFALGTGGNLASIQLLLAGSATTYNLELFDMGPSYTQSASSFAISGLTSIYSTTGITFSGVAGVTKIDFTGLDSVSLAAGNYGLALTKQSGSDLGWARGGADTFAGDMLYRSDATSYGPINGSGAPYRHAALAVTVIPVPEPTTLALAVTGLASLFMVRRSKNKE